MKGLVLIGDLFEDVEMIAPVDILRRNKDDITIASVMHRKEVISARGIKMEADALIEDLDLDTFDFLFIPGGPGAYKLLVNIESVKTTIKYFVKQNKVVSAICAAPMLIGRLGLLKGKHYTVYPGFEEQIPEGIYLKDQGVVVDDNFVTGKSMYYAIDFGLALVKKLYNNERANHLALSIKGKNDE